MGKRDPSKRGRPRRAGARKGKIAEHWLWRHPTNMLAKAKGILRRYKRYARPEVGEREAQRFVDLHSNRCESCRGPLPAKWTRFKRGEKE
jgi:hypothetical protein